MADASPGGLMAEQAPLVGGKGGSNGAAASTDPTLVIPTWFQSPKAREVWSSKGDKISMNYTSGGALPWLYSTAIGLALMRFFLIGAVYATAECVHGPDGDKETYPKLLKLVVVPVFVLWCVTLFKTASHSLLPLASVAAQSGKYLFKLPMIEPESPIPCLRRRAGFDIWWLYTLANGVANFSTLVTNALFIPVQMGEARCGLGKKIEAHWTILDRGSIVPSPSLMQCLVGLMVVTAIQTFYPLMRSIRTHDRQTLPNGLCIGKEPLFCLTLFDGDVTMLLSESVGFTFLQSSAITYRRGRVKMRENEMLQKPLPWSEKDSEGCGSQIDIALALAKQILIRFGVTTLCWNAFSFSIQVKVFLLHNYLGMGNTERISLLCTISLSAFTTFLTLLDANALREVVGTVSATVEKSTWDASTASVNGNTLSTLNRRVMLVFLVSLLLVIILMYGGMSIVATFFYCDRYREIFSWGTCVVMDS